MVIALNIRVIIVMTFHLAVFASLIMSLSLKIEHIFTLLLLHHLRLWSLCLSFSYHLSLFHLLIPLLKIFHLLKQIHQLLIQHPLLHLHNHYLQLLFLFLFTIVIAPKNFSLLCCSKVLSPPTSPPPLADTSPATNLPHHLIT